MVASCVQVNNVKYSVKYVKVVIYKTTVFPHKVLNILMPLCVIVYMCMMLQTFVQNGRVLAHTVE